MKLFKQLIGLLIVIAVLLCGIALFPVFFGVIALLLVLGWGCKLLDGGSSS